MNEELEVNPAIITDMVIIRDTCRAVKHYKDWPKAYRTMNSMIHKWINYSYEWELIYKYSLDCEIEADNRIIKNGVNRSSYQNLKSRWISMMIW